MNQIQRDTLFNLLGAGLPLLVAIPSVPLFLHFIGSERYGILAICWVVVGYFAFFDFGMGKAVNQRVAANPDQAAQVLWLGLFTSAFLGLIGAAIVTIAGIPLLANLQLSSELRLETSLGLPWLVLAVWALTLNSVFQGALEARHRFIAANVIAMSVNVFLQALPLGIAIFVSPRLEYLLCGTALARVLSLGLAMYYNRDLLRQYKSFNWRESRSLLQFGGWVTVTGVVGPLLTVADQVFIGALLGVSASAHYSIAYNVVTRVLIIPSATMRALFPRFANQNQATATAMMSGAINAIMLIMTPIMLLAALLLRPLFTLWLGHEVAASTVPVGLILLLGVWFNAIAFVPFNWLQATGSPDIPARFHLLELLPYVLLLWLLLPRFGVVAAAAVWTLRALVDAILLFTATKDCSHLSALIQHGSMVILALGMAFIPSSNLLVFLQFSLVSIGGIWLFKQARAAFLMAGNKPSPDSTM